MKKRCAWVNLSDENYVKYHDEEWGVPLHDDRRLFEMLILEGAQAGLSWATILKKRDGYRDLFCDFEVDRVAQLSDQDCEKILLDSRIVRNRLKVFGAVKNARAFMKVQEEFGSFDRYIWDFVGGERVVNSFKEMSEVPAKTELSDKISKELKKRGFTFVGSTIVYAFMQAVGMVNDHEVGCFRYREV